MRLRALSLVGLTMVIATGCGSPASAPSQPVQSPVAMTQPSQSAPSATASSSTAAPAAPLPTAQVDPVVQGMTTEGITKLCDEHLSRAKSLLQSIRELKGQPDEALTWEKTMGRVDEISLELSVGGGFAALMAVAHPEKDVREAAKACEPKMDKFHTDMMLDSDFAAVVKRYAAKGEKLDGTRGRLLSEQLRDFRRNGLELTPEKQQQLRTLNEQLTKLQQDFTSNISDSVLTLKVKPAQLKGLPQSFLDQHKPGEDGLITLTTNYPDYFPVVTYAEDRQVARELTALFDNRAADKNLAILDQVLKLRQQKAELLGYKTWADYAIEPRMAKTAKTVQGFLDKLAKEVKGPARKEYAEFEGLYRKLGGKVQGRLPNYERVYLEQKLREQKYGFDAKELSEYFEVGQVTQGLLQIVQKLYGIQFREVPNAPKWHADVKVLDVMEGGKQLGRIYLDLYPREGKYKHAAMFEIRSGKKLASGEYLAPIAALECNFPKPGEAPALMTHSDVTTFFHEFGHVLHHVLTHQELASYAGTNTVRDFVEAPSQMFEEWSFRRETLDLFAKHYKTGQPIPEKLFQAMSRARSFGRALHTERQVSLAMLDFTYHSHALPLDTDKVFQEVMQKTQQFAYLPNTHFQATFGHLMGYDAGYYSYQWALAIARDVLTRFDKEGYLNEKVASDWRKLVLEQGAGPDENKLVEQFLGRPTDLKAYSQYLQGR